MPIIVINDLDDPRLAPYRHLKATNLTRDRDEFVVEGAKLVERLLASRFPVVSVLATDRHALGLVGRVPESVMLYVVPHELLRTLVGFSFHQGVLGCGTRRPWPEPVSWLRDRGPRLTIVVCPELCNPENLGSMLRLADVFGIDGALVGPNCPDPFSRRVLRVSMGFALWRPTLVAADLPATCARLRDELGFELVAAVVDPDAEPFDARPRPDRLALVLGTEADGLAPDWVARCQRRVTIPMRPGAESLNVALAAGILLYHFSRPGDPGSALAGLD